MFFVFELAVVSFGFFLSTVIDSQRTAYSVSFAFMLGGLIIQMMLGNSVVMHVIFFP